MNDWIGLAFFVLLIVAALVGIRVLANPKKRTSDDFEKGAAENTTMTGALLNALHDITDPGAARAKEVRMQMKDGTFRKKSGKGRRAELRTTKETMTGWIWIMAVSRI